MTNNPAFVETLLAHAKLYVDLATRCADERLALEFRHCAQQCLEVAAAATRISVIASQIGMLTAHERGSGQAIH